MQTSEKAHAASRGSARISRPLAMSENCDAQGQYTARLRRISDKHLSPYWELFQRQVFIESKSLLERIPFLAELASIRERIAELSFDLVWEKSFKNVVCTPGKDLMLDTTFEGAAYTATGPYMVLISSISYSTIVPADTPASHAGWLEAGASNNPTYSGTRPAVSMGAAVSGSKATDVVASFTIVVGGTAKGCGIIIGSGASSTIDDTGGTLWSAGLFTGGDVVLAAADILEVTYSTAL